MADFTQDGRAFRLITPLGTDVLLLQGFTAREAISSPYLISVEAVSENPAISADELLMQPVTVEVYTHQGELARHFHGLVRSFTRTGRRAEYLTGYRMEVVPRFWFLSLRRDVRIFQDKNVPDIVAEVLQERGITFDNRLQKSYPVREYCVQYRESDLNLVSRLLEGEGIHYYFEHTDSGHTMVLGDSAGGFDPCVDGGSIRFAVPGEDDPGGEVVTRFTRSHRMHSGKVTLADYDHVDPSASLRPSVTASNPESVDFGEFYDYPGLDVTRDGLERYADLRLRALEQFAVVGNGTSVARVFRSGTRFTLEGHEDRASNGEYLITDVTHTGYNGSYTAGDAAEPDYHNEFSTVQHPNDFRPPRTTPVPVIHGAQTAEVVGPEGDEIHVDATGRIRVHFHWDRLGQRNETSTCWVRVMTNTAGNRWGMIHIPRIGQEVVVTFLEGNPDRPLVTGAVYNGANEPPYPLPAQGLVQGIKTRTSPDGGGYNELILDDRKNRELIRMHAQKNLQVKVLNTESHHVGKHQLHMIGGARGVLIEGEEMISLDEPDEEGEVAEEGEWEFPVGDVLVVTSNRYVEINKAQGVKCEEGHSLLVVEGDNYSEVETGNHQEIVTDGDHTIDVETGNQSILVGTGDQLTEVTSGDIDMKAKSGKITLDASTEIKLKVGGSSLTITPSTIELKIGGSKLTMNNSGVTVKGMNTKVKGDLGIDLQGGLTAKLKGGLQTTVEGGVGITVKGGVAAGIQGGTVKIN
jgi:type VI secretion system secreted protein VgrG